VGKISKPIGNHDSTSGVVRRAGVWILYAATVAPVLFSARTIYPYVVPRAVYLRVCVATAAGIALYLLSTTRPATDDSGPRPWRDPVLLALAALVAIQLLAALTGEAPQRSLFGDMERMGGVIEWLHYLALYVALRTLPTEREFASFLRIAMIVGIAASGVAILQSLGVSVGILPGATDERVIGTLGNAGYLAIYALLGMAVAGLVAEDARGSLWKALAALAMVMSGTALLMAYTRAAVAGLGVGLLAGLIAYGWMGGARRRRWSLAAAAVIALTAGGGLWLRGRDSGDGSRGIDRLLSVSLSERGVGNRLSAWEAGVRAVADDPLTGLGPENFRLAFDWHFQPERFPPDVHFNRAHNELVESLVADGLPGGLAWIAVWCTLFYVLIAARREGKLGIARTALLVGAFTAYLVYLLFWFQEQNSFVLFVALGALVGHQRDGPYLSQPPYAPRSLATRLSVGAILAILVLTDAAYQARVLAVGQHLVKAAEAGRVETAVHEYERAVTMRPPGAEEVATELVRYASLLPGRLGQALRDPRTKASVESILGGARGVLADQVDRDPHNPRLRRDAGSLLVVRYQVSQNPAFLDSAVTSFERAVELAPGRLRYRHMLSEAYLMSEEPDEAVRVLEEGLSRYDRLGETHYYLAKAILIQGSYMKAAEALIRAYELGYVNPSGAVHDVLARELRSRGEMEAVGRLRDARAAAMNGR